MREMTPLEQEIFGHWENRKKVIDAYCSHLFEERSKESKGLTQRVIENIRSNVAGAYDMCKKFDDVKTAVWYFMLITETMRDSILPEKISGQIRDTARLEQEVREHWKNEKEVIAIYCGHLFEERSKEKCCGLTQTMIKTIYKNAEAAYRMSKEFDNIDDAVEYFMIMTETVRHMILPEGEG